MNIFEVKAFTNNLYFFYQINYYFRAFSRKACHFKFVQAQKESFK